MLIKKLNFFQVFLSDSASLQAKPTKKPGASGGNANSQVGRAIGAKRKQIVSQFLIETSVLSTIGGLIGIGFGVLVPVLITHFAGMPTVITLESILLPLFIGAGVGLIFGLYPAIRAGKVDPIVALRHE